MLIVPLCPSLWVVFRLRSQRRARVHLDLFLGDFAGESPVELTIAAKNEFFKILSLLLIILSNLV
jgi:hypothetical protein